MSSRSAAARKLLQDPHPRVSASEQSNDQVTPFPFRRAVISSTPHHDPDANLMPTSTVHESSVSPRRLDLSHEFPQPPPSTEYPRTYFPHKSSDKKSKRNRSSRASPVHVVPDQTAPPPNPRHPMPAPPAEVPVTYLPDLPLPPSYPPPSPTKYSGHPAVFYVPSSSLPTMHRGPSPTPSDLPEYRSTYSYYPETVHIGRPPLQVGTPYRDNHHTYYQCPSPPRPHPYVSPPAKLATFPSINNESRFPYQLSPVASNSSSLGPVRTSPATSPEVPGDSASVSSLSRCSATSTSTGGSQPPPPPPTPDFVFPGSRSTARPKVSTTITNASHFKLRSSKLPKSPQENLHAHDIPSQDAQVAYETSPVSPASVLTSVQSISPDSFPEASTAMLGDDLKRKSTSSARKEPTETIFPPSRSRAQPKSSSARRASSSSSPNYSSTSKDVNQPGSSRLMEILLFKKRKAKAPNISPVPNTIESDVVALPAEAVVREGQRLSEPTLNFAEHQTQTRRMRPRTYPLDPYDSVLLDNDRRTGELLSRLNPTGSPSFDRRSAPPSSVLDLGCGQGNWVLEAAIAWKQHGTNVTGYDMVDISRNVLPRAVEQGVRNNIRFVKGDFLKRLPFDSNTFDLVRMSCLTLCITSDAWGFVLQEVYRVLMTGGRLELIDDQIFFPYGQVSSLINHSNSFVSVTPRVGVVISPTVTRFSILGDLVEKPRSPLEQRGPYRSCEDDTSSAPRSRKSRTTAGTSTAQTRPNSSPALSAEDWDRALVISQDLEALFEHMLLDDFDIHKDPSNFILSLMWKVFGQAREVETMHLVLAPPDSMAQSESSQQGLSHYPGLILLPSTFISMDHTEVEIHASKHLRTLLSCKNYLSQHAIEISDGRVDEDFVSEALWEYENFLRHRFNPRVSSSVDVFEESETSSIHCSIAESTNSDTREAMLEIQSEFRQRFAWLPQRDSANTLNSHQDKRPSIGVITPSPPGSLLSASSAGHRHNSESLTRPSSYSSCNNKLTHVRTFRVYEAIKVDNYILAYDTH